MSNIKLTSVFLLFICSLTSVRRLLAEWPTSHQPSNKWDKNYHLWFMLCFYTLYRVRNWTTNPCQKKKKKSSIVCLGGQLFNPNPFLHSQNWFCSYMNIFGFVLKPFLKHDFGTKPKFALKHNQVHPKSILQFCKMLIQKQKNCCFLVHLS